MGKSKTKTEDEVGTLPPDDELLGQQYLFKDDLLVLANKYAALKVRQSKVANEVGMCKLALLAKMKEMKISKGAADLSDGEKIEFSITSSLKTKKVVAK